MTLIQKIMHRNKKTSAPRRLRISPDALAYTALGLGLGTLAFIPEASASGGLEALAVELNKGVDFFRSPVLKTGLLGATIIGTIASVVTGNMYKAVIIIVLGLILTTYIEWIVKLGS